MLIHRGASCFLIEVPTITIAMRVDSSARETVAKLTEAAAAPAQTREQLQAKLLRQVLDGQETQAAELLKILEGKGKNLDIRA